MGNARNAGAREKTEPMENHRSAATTRHWMPIPKTRKASSTYGIAIRWRKSVAGRICRGRTPLRPFG